MAANAIVKVYDDDSNEVMSMYLHNTLNAYPMSKNGKQLIKYLAGIKMINGFNPFRHKLNEYANGAECLAAQLVAEFKTEVGDVYLFAREFKAFEVDYIYKIRVVNHEIWLQIIDTNGCSVLYDDTAKNVHAQMICDEIDILERCV